ncbi:4-(cytidine 5'-diphospho)-2-C-methyl-D-erythritol kinase [Actinomyces vulturis]|uniref:4-(cytidine 5'-diphospho)-2-C-methyl-D-erythritol kinase n=1 Tax=Actinomyces vulturis TaxID=1857645 RepID=UPI00082D311D|nr:4-(cytidine 5'-diphospho)-2-C-methyl-D-erythritol kinase [Actinomyces vulturis]
MSYLRAIHPKRSGGELAGVQVCCPGKVNLFLSAGSPTSDGYHPLTTVFQAVNVHETVIASVRDHQTSVTMSLESPNPSVPTDESNLAVRAALLFKKRYGITQGVHLHVDKKIPAAGGMAGGSADAAATLRACDALFNSEASLEDLESLARELGADVPFLLTGGVALAEGRGDLITPLTTDMELTWVLAFQREGLSTPAVFREFDRLHDGREELTPAAMPEPLIKALREGDIDLLADSLCNDLEQAAINLHPDMAETLRLARSSGALAAMVSGSGPTVAALVTGPEQARSVQTLLETLPQVAGTMIVHGPVAGAHVEN